MIVIKSASEPVLDAGSQLEKGEALKRADVEASLWVMVLMLQLSNRQNQDALKLFQDRRDVHGFTPCFVPELSATPVDVALRKATASRPAFPGRRLTSWWKSRGASWRGRARSKCT